MEDKDALIAQLRTENQNLQTENQKLIKELQSLRSNSYIQDQSAKAIGLDFSNYQKRMASLKQWAKELQEPIVQNYKFSEGIKAEFMFDLKTTQDSFHETLKTGLADIEREKWKSICGKVLEIVNGHIAYFKDVEGQFNFVLKTKNETEEKLKIVSKTEKQNSKSQIEDIIRVLVIRKTELENFSASLREQIRELNPTEAKKTKAQPANVPQKSGT